jgi:hypothetical protein
MAKLTGPTPMRPLLVLVALLSVAGCGGAMVDVQPIGTPTVYGGRVVAARGPTMARTNDTCSVEVRETDGGYLNCRIRIRCSGDLVYGLTGAGYNNCRRTDERFTFAHDTSGTRRDGDPRMFFDLEAGRVIISDDDPDVEVLVDLMRNPPGYEPEDEAGEEEDPEPREEPDAELSEADDLEP